MFVLNMDTRQQILNIVYEDMKIHGFQGLRADKVIKDLNITKGALYHHFSNKFELGYAVVDEIIAPQFIAYWKPMETYSGNPLDYIIKSIRNVQQLYRKQNNVVGSPLSNLIQEMSPIDEGFRKRLSKIVHRIHSIIKSSLEEGISIKVVKANVQSEQLAWFILAAFEGSYSVSKVEPGGEIFNNSLSSFIHYLEQLKQ